MPEQIKRRAPSKAEILEILQQQGTDLQGFVAPQKATSEAQLFALILAHIGRVPCGNFAICGGWILAKKECRRDHKIPLRQVPAAMRADYDGPKNQWFLCLSCDRSKTFRRGHNSAGLSDATLNAKLRRLEKKYAEPAATEPKERQPCKTKIRSGSLSNRFPRPWPTGRKIQNRPWPTASSRPGKGWSRQP